MLRKQELAPVAVGRLHPDRWQEYRELRLQALEEEPVAFQDPSRGKNKLLKLQEGEWRAMLEGRSYDQRTRKIVCVAESGGRVVGMVDVEIAQIVREKKITVNNMFVSKDFRRQRIGNKLIEALINELKKDKELQGSDFEVNLMVYGTQKEAITLYQSLGFEITEIIKDDKEHNGQKIDRYIMKKAFKND